MYLFSKRESLSLSELVRLISLLFIVLLPFQNLPRTLSLKLTNNVGQLSKFFLFTDELLTATLILILLSWICLHGLQRKLKKLSVSYILLLFIFICFLCMFINHIGFYRGALGIFDYTKNIAVVIIFYWLGFRYAEFKKGLILFINIGLLVAVIGIVGVFLSFFTDSVIDILVRHDMRFGFHRATSVAGIGSSNYVGVYAVLVFWLLTAVQGQVAHLREKQGLLLLFILFTASRQTWLSFLVILIFHGGKKQLLISSSLVLLLGTSGYLLDIWHNNFSANDLVGGLSYRHATYALCWNYFKNNPLFGVGPGMLGGLAVQRLWSPLYSHLPPDVDWFLHQMRGGLDQFWGRLFADVGGLGGGIYVLFFLLLARELTQKSRFFYGNNENEMGMIGTILASYILVLFIMGLAGGINAAMLEYPFLAFTGIYLSLHSSSKYVAENQKINEY